MNSQGNAEVPASLHLKTAVGNDVGECKSRKGNAKAENKAVKGADGAIKGQFIH